jgi:hypothetical protein
MCVKKEFDLDQAGIISPINKNLCATQNVRPGEAINNFIDMTTQNTVNDRLSSRVDIEFPDFTKSSDDVRKKFEGLPTKVNFFRMMGYSPGAFVEIIDLTNAIFKKLQISDYHKELLVLLVASHEGSKYEWEQHVSIAQAAGIREDQFIAIAANRLDDEKAFDGRERILLSFGMSILEKGKAQAVVFKNTLRYFSIGELSDAMIVIGFYRMLSGFIQTFDLPLDPQEDGNWVKG